MEYVFVAEKKCPTKTLKGLNILVSNTGNITFLIQAKPRNFPKAWLQDFIQ